MKTMINKRRFLAALSVVLLISAVLIVASCLNPLDEKSVQQQQGGDNIPPPAGKGLIRISVSDNARTIMPSMPAKETLWYTVQFVGDNIANNLNYPEITDTSTDSRASYGTLTTTPIALAADNYQITITAWSTDGIDTTDGLGDGVGLEIAGWTADASHKIQITAGGSSPVTAVLSGFVGSGTGGFSYTIGVPALPPSTWGLITSPPATYTTAVMKIFKGASQQGGDITLRPSDESVGGSFSSTVSSMPVGYYTVDIELTATSCQSRKGIYVLHIYKDQTSSFTYNIPPLNQNKFTVRFNKQLTGGETDTNNILTSDQPNISNAGYVQNLSGNPAHSAGYDFKGWFDNALGSGTAWVLGASGTKVFKDTTLYAKWDKGITFIITMLSDIVIDKYDNNDDTPGIDAGSGPYSYALFVTDGKILTYKVRNPDLYDNIVWKLEDTTVATGPDLIINSSNTTFLTALVSGNHRIIVSGHHKTGGVDLDGYINIFCVN